MTEYACSLAARLASPATRFCLVVTGAGVSAASGLATFRGTDPGAIWARDVTEIGTIAWFRDHPVEWWLWFLDRFEGVREVRPNPAHHAIAALERWQSARDGRFLVVTQNVDTLHEQAGTRSLVKVHGSADRVRCSRFGCPNGAPSGSLPAGAFDVERFRREPGPDTLPRCPDCGSLLRAHALLFDEYYDEHDDYGFSRVTAALEQADLALFVGTSFSVGVTELAIRSVVMRGIPAVSIDPAARPIPGLEPIPENAETILPRVVELLQSPDPLSRATL